MGTIATLPSRHRRLAFLGLLGALMAALALASVPAASGGPGEGKRVMIYTGTTGFRHAGAINEGRPVVQSALGKLGFTVDWEDCNGFGTAAGQCQNPDENPRVFSDANLANYDAILFLNASDFFSGTGGTPGQLFGASSPSESTPQREAIIDFVRNGGGIAAVHNFTDAGAGQTTWNWWDANNGNSVVGTTMAGHAATSLSNVAQVHVEDPHHLSTRDLPDQYGFGDEHYNWDRNVRGDHHVLLTSTRARTTRVPTRWARITRSPSASSTTATTSRTAPASPSPTATVAPGSPGWATSAPPTRSRATASAWSNRSSAESAGSPATGRNPTAPCEAKTWRETSGWL
jgi:hypothetical protein